MKLFGTNIQILRKRRNLSQQDVADELKIKRSSVSGYELGNSEPGLELLLQFADFFKVPVDVLLRKDLTKTMEFELRQLEQGWSHARISGKGLRVLATTIGDDNEENVELVPVKAKAGYTRGFSDPEFISVMPAFRLPFLSREKKYRTFPVSGDSMPPVSDGSWVTGEYVTNWNHVKSGQPYIFILKDDGIVFKIAYNHIADEGGFLLCSTNPEYKAYLVKLDQVLEIWKFTHYISAELPEPNLMKEDLTAAVVKLQKEVAQLRMKLE